jgi:hypothetical protein
MQASRDRLVTPSRGLGGTQVAVALVLWLVACAVVAGFIAPQTPNTGFPDSAAVIAFISLVAVSIERAIEGFFTVMAGPFGQWWPLNVVRAEFDTFEQQTNGLLHGVVDQTLAELRTAKSVAGDGTSAARDIQAAIDEVVREQARLSAQFDDVTSKLPKGSSRLARVSEINASLSMTLHQAQGVAAEATTEAQRLLREAGDVADRASLVIASFQDNPARRIASLVIGAGLGMVIAGGAGLNVFAATLGTGAGAGSLAAFLAGTLGVVVTGMVMGLGSAPTHELVKSLQTYKEARTPPDPVATVAGGGGPRPADIQEAFGPGGTAVVVDRPMRMRIREVRSTS